MCIAIISILVMLVVPSIARTKDLARLTLCQNTLRSLGTGLLTYAEDNGGRLPVDNMLDNPHLKLIAALKGYVTDPRTYYCPALNQGDSCFSADNLQAGRIGYFYYSCEQATSNSDVSTFLRWEVAWPRRLCVGLDGDYWLAGDQWFSAQPTSHRYYNKGVNYVLLGGSVRFVEASPRQQFK